MSAALPRVRPLKTIRPRSPRFDFDAVPRRWFARSVLGTHMANGLNLLFPAGERFFVRSVRRYLDRIDDPQLREDIKGFSGQEGLHAYAHERYFEALEKQGYDIRGFLGFYEKFAYGFVEKDRPRRALPRRHRRVRALHGDHGRGRARARGRRQHGRAGSDDARALSLARRRGDRAPRRGLRRSARGQPELRASRGRARRGDVDALRALDDRRRHVARSGARAPRSTRSRAPREARVSGASRSAAVRMPRSAPICGGTFIRRRTRHATSSRAPTRSRPGCPESASTAPSKSRQPMTAWRGRPRFGLARRGRRRARPPDIKVIEPRLDEAAARRSAERQRHLGSRRGIRPRPALAWGNAVS